MNRVIAKYQDDLELHECVKSAFTDFQILLNEVFVNLRGCTNQLDIDGLFILFVRYDWRDIVDIIQELDNTPFHHRVYSPSSILELLEIYQVSQISDPRQNTYYRVWAGLISDES
jgi:hypothetical protein